MATFRHGKNAVFKIGSSGTPGTATDISNVLNDVTFPKTISTAETTSFGSTAKTYVVGLLDTTISITGTFDATVDSQLSGLVGVDGVAFEYGPEGSTTGNTKYTGSCVMTSYESNAPIGGVVTIKAAFQVSGAVTRATY
jgi:spore germination protein YaaH